MLAIYFHFYEISLIQIAQRNYSLLIASMETSFQLTNPFLFSWQQPGDSSAEMDAAGSRASNSKPNPVTKVAIHSPHVFELEQLLVTGGPGEDGERTASASRKDRSGGSRGRDRARDQEPSIEADKGQDFPYILQVITLRQKDGSKCPCVYIMTYLSNLTSFSALRAACSQLRLHIHS